MFATRLQKPGESPHLHPHVITDVVVQGPGQVLVGGSIAASFQVSQPLFICLCRTGRTGRVCEQAGGQDKTRLDF
jgi:hypothetical protein